jgi:alkanesulfonate monooxygenase SsuD/methylene tetrahydromethanopterin reductase-like flavin-dependent oxidoreductase (luciferase family)
VPVPGAGDRRDDGRDDRRSFRALLCHTAHATVAAMSRLPALSVIGTPTKRGALLDVAADADRRGFAGLASPGIHGNLALCGSLAHVTESVPFWTSIQPIYHSHPAEVAVTAAHLFEVSGGRFRLGLGVSHEPAMSRLGISTGKPLSDMRDYVGAIRAAERSSGATPPIYLATLRNKMLDLALDVADGAIWANASRSYMPTQVARIPDQRRDSFFLANMVPTVIDADRAAARAIHRRTLATYVTLPNYRNYWKEAGYREVMLDIETALEKGERDKLPELMPDHWIDDCTLSGSADQVRDGLDGWYSVGVTPIAVMSSTTGGQLKAIQQLFDLYPE